MASKIRRQILLVGFFAGAIYFPTNARPQGTPAAKPAEPASLRRFDDYSW